MEKTRREVILERLGELVSQSQKWSAVVSLDNSNYRHAAGMMSDLREYGRAVDEYTSLEQELINIDKKL